MNDVTVLLIVVAAVAAISWLVRRSSGRIAPTDAVFSAEDLTHIGAAAGVTNLLVFTAPGCAPCQIARRVADDAAERHGATVVTVDVTEHAAIAKDKHVWRAPTVFVVDPRGRTAARIWGVPRPEALDAVLGMPVASG